MLSGKNIMTVPNERTMSGQNMSSAPVCGERRASQIMPKVRMRPPNASSTRAS